VAGPAGWVDAFAAAAVEQEVVEEHMRVNRIESD